MRDTFSVEAPAHIPTLAGVRDQQPGLSWPPAAASTPSAGRFDLPWGVDEALLGALATGARGGGGIPARLGAGGLRRAAAAFERGDLRRGPPPAITVDRDGQNAIGATGYMGTSKAVMGRLGVPGRRARAPHPPRRPRGERGRRDGAARSLGFTEWGAAAV